MSHTDHPSPGGAQSSLTPIGYYPSPYSHNYYKHNAGIINKPKENAFSNLLNLLPTGNVTFGDHVKPTFTPIIGWAETQKYQNRIMQILQIPPTPLRDITYYFIQSEILKQKPKPVNITNIPSFPEAQDKDDSFDLHTAENIQQMEVITHSIREKVQSNHALQNKINKKLHIMRSTYCNDNLEAI